MAGTTVVETFIPRGSSNIGSVSYDPDSQKLSVTFVSGDTYDYFNVPQSIYSGFTAAGSAGQFFYRQVRDRYAYEQV